MSERSPKKKNVNSENISLNCYNNRAELYRGWNISVLNTAFSAREANYSDEIFAKHYVTKFTCTRAENVEIWRQIQVTMGIISNSFSFNREINLSLDTKYLKVQRLGIYCFAPR